MNISFINSSIDLPDAFFEYREDQLTKKYNPLRSSTKEALNERLSKACSDWSQFSNSEVPSFFWFIKIDNEIVGTARKQSCLKKSS